MLGRKLIELTVLDCLHLMHQTPGHIDAFSSAELELLDSGGIGRLFHSHFQLATPQIERLELSL